MESSDSVLYSGVIQNKLKSNPGSYQSPMEPMGTEGQETSLGNV